MVPRGSEGPGGGRAFLVGLWVTSGRCWRGDCGGPHNGREGREHRAERRPTHGHHSSRDAFLCGRVRGQLLGYGLRNNPHSYPTAPWLRASAHRARHPGSGAGIGYCGVGGPLLLGQRRAAPGAGRSAHSRDLRRDRGPRRRSAWLWRCLKDTMRLITGGIVISMGFLTPALATPEKSCVSLRGIEPLCWD